MKLLLCVKCNEVFSLSRTVKECRGKHCGGMYTDDVNAEVWAITPEICVVLGFSNRSLINTIIDQRHEGDLASGAGRVFEAFLIPANAKSVTRTTRHKEEVDHEPRS